MLIYIKIYTREKMIYIYFSRVYVYKIGGTGTLLGNGHIFFIISIRDGKERVDNLGTLWYNDIYQIRKD